MSRPVRPIRWMSDAVNDELMAMVDAGVNYNVIAAHFNTTKNAIAGAVYRERDRRFVPPPPNVIQFPRQGGCVWPLGHPDKPDFHFCGERTSGRVYCDEHCAVAYFRRDLAQAS